MGFKLTKDQAQQHAENCRALADAADTLTEAYEKFQVTIDAARLDYNAAIAEYNNALDTARGFVTDQASEWRGEYDERSEKWQESDKGQDADERIQSWEDADLSDVEEIEEFDIFSPEDTTAAHVDALDTLDTGE